MEGYRLANLIMQAAYLPLHLALLARLLRKGQPTPIWRWFMVVAGGLLLMVSGRLLETIAYLFYPVNGFYVFAVYYQLVGTTFATFAYLIWNLYLAGHDRLAESRAFKALLQSAALCISLIVCTNHRTGLFYEKLVMGEQVVHGKLFLPCLLLVYGTLLAGYLVSVVHIIRRESDKLKRLVVFSLYPLLPAVAALIRSISGVDRLDLTPAIMTVSVLCLYLLIFKYRYVNIIPQSIDEALAQTGSGIFVYVPGSNAVTYANRSAQENFSGVLEEILPRLEEGGGSLEGTFDGRSIKASVTPLEEGGALLVTLRDVSGIAGQRRKLEQEIRRQKELIRELEEKKRNIDAYLDALYQIPDLKEKQERLARMEERIGEAFAEIEGNLSLAEADLPQAGAVLQDNLRITQTTIASIRAVVAGLKEGP